MGTDNVKWTEAFEAEFDKAFNDALSRMGVGVSIDGMKAETLFGTEYDLAKDAAERFVCKLVDLAVL